MSESVLAGLQSDSIVGPDRHQFRLSKPLGTHPYGTLWLAEDLATTTKTHVMLLFLPELVNQQPKVLEELKKQVILSRKCHHPHALACYGVFTHKGALFVAFETTEGLTLDKMLDQTWAQKLTPEQKQGLVIQAGKALDAFHKATRKAHSSISPELFFISPGKGVKLMLLGGRHLLDDLLDLLVNPPLYRQYQAPEGFDPLPTTQRSDVYAFAAVIYHLYAGKPPFAFQDDEKSRFQRELKAPSNLDTRQWHVLQSALTPEVDARPASVMLLLKQLFTDATTDAGTTESEPGPIALPQTDQNAEPRPGWISRLPAGLAHPMFRLLEQGHRLPRHLILFSVFVLGMLVGIWVTRLLQPTVSAYPPELHAPEPLLSPETLSQEPDATSDNLESEETDQLSSDEEEITPDKSSPLLMAMPRSRQVIATGETTERLRFQDFFGEGHYAPVMQELPTGEFLMGDLQRLGDDNERPVREISIGYRFAIGVYEVTFAEYDQFAQATNRPLPDDAGWGRGNRPVINVSWQDAHDYARWLREVTGQPYRLPSEAEWEYAARAGTGSPWWWGTQLEPAMAVCDGCGTQWDGRQTAPVGQLPANPWGIADMHGNVEEWVEDCYTDHYALAPEDGSPMRAGNCQFRVLRGGSWFDIPRVIRSSSRYRQAINTTQNTFGFRVAVDLPLTALHPTD